MIALDAIQLDFLRLHLVVGGFFAALIFVPVLRHWFERHCLGQSTALDLAFIRIVTCAVTGLIVFREDLASYSYFDPEWYRFPGHIRLLGDDFLRSLIGSRGALLSLKWGLFLLLLLAGAGGSTRLTIPLVTVLYILFAALARSCGKGFHEGYLPMYVLMVLSFLPCGDAWSVQFHERARWWHRPRPDPKARSQVYRWGTYACYAAVCVPYIQLAFSKIMYGGLDWFQGSSLLKYMLSDSLSLTGWDFGLSFHLQHAPGWVLSFAGFFALAVETVYPLVLFVPRLRFVLPLCVTALHLGIWFTQEALFADAILMPVIFLSPILLKRWR